MRLLYAAALRKKLVQHLKPIIGIVNVMIKIYVYYGRAVTASLHLAFADPRRT